MNESRLFKMLILVVLTGCYDSDLNKLRSVSCTMQFIDKCEATLGSGKTIWMNAHSSAETEVPYTNSDSECRKAANKYEFSGPSYFVFTGGIVVVKDAIQSAGDYLFSDKAGTQFHYVKVGEADFRQGEESGKMKCNQEVVSNPHDY